jgi:hypothetical protein
MHLALMPGSGVMISRTGVALMAPLLNVHHIVRSLRRLLCSKGELSGLFFIVHQRIPSGTLICHFLQRGISIGPSSICMWAAVEGGFLFWQLSGPYILQNVPCVFIIQLFRSQRGQIPASCGYRRNSSYLLDVCSHLDLWQ